MNTPFTGTKQALPVKIDLILWTQQENWHLSFIIYLIVCQASFPFAAVEADAKNVTGSFAAWNNRTSSTNSNVSDQVFSGVKRVEC